MNRSLFVGLGSLALLMIASWGVLRGQGARVSRPRSLPRQISQGTAAEEPSLPDVVIASPTNPATEGEDLPSGPSVAQAVANDWEEVLEIPTDVAARVTGILLRRDVEAERILAPHLEELTRDRLANLYPRLQSVEWQADREIEALLTLPQVEAYRRFRVDGTIPGVAISPPPVK